MAFLRDIFIPVRNVFNPLKDLVASPLLDSSSGNFFVKFYFDDSKLLYGLAASLTAVSVWEIYLMIRQRRVLINQQKVPLELEKYMDKEKFEKSRQYALDNITFNIIKSQCDLILNTATLLLMVHVPIWAISGAIAQWIGLPMDRYEISQACCFIIIHSLIDKTIHLPFKLYSTFVIEEKHGFNNQTLDFFVKDQIKAFLVMHVVALPLFSGILYMKHMKIGGSLFPLCAWAFSTVGLLALMTIYPMYIAPLFDKFTPLPEGELRTQIEALAKSLDYPLTKLFVVEGSKRSAHSNAYLYGFFKNKRIVLFDTLIKEYQPTDKKDLTAEEKQKGKKDHGCSNEEIVAILGHELGHWKHSHTVKNLAIFECQLMVFSVLFQKVLKSKMLYETFGFIDSQPAAIGLLIIVGNVLRPCSVVMKFLMCSLSRRYEYQADMFAASLGYSKPLQAALIKLHLDNLSFPFNDELYSMYNFSHPTLIERLRAISKIDKTE